MEQTSAKHVLVIVDKREGTASRKKDATDLMTLWQDKLDDSVNYQLATYPLDIGDIWICTSENGPFNIPPEWAFAPDVPESQVAPPTMDDFFQPPSASSLNGLSEIVVPTASPTAFPPARPDIVIERKALADLKSSYGDGRYKDQKARLVNCDANLVVLLIEGYQGSRVKDVTLKKRYLSTFVHSMFRDNMPVYHTHTIQDSFDFLHHLATEMALGKLERTADYMERTKYTDNIQMTRKQNLTPERGLEMQLACIPGVSAKMARAVQAVYPSMTTLCAAYVSLGDDERAKHDLLADLTFRGTSGKEQRLASRSSKIYQYVTGQESTKPPKKKAATKKEKTLQSPAKKRLKTDD